MAMTEEIRKIILKYGRDILGSDEFRETFSQTHHMDTTVGDHTLGVAAEAVRICLKYHQTDDGTLKNAVVSSLCHDLGIIGRDEKYKNNVQCLIRHPIDSIEAYKSVTGEEEEKGSLGFHRLSYVPLETPDAEAQGGLDTGPC